MFSKKPEYLLKPGMVQKNGHPHTLLLGMEIITIFLEGNKELFFFQDIVVLCFWFLLEYSSFRMLG